MKFVYDSTDEEILRSRLINWKFKSAMKYVSVFDKEGDNEARDVLEALSESYADTGWFSGNMATIVGVAVDMLLGRF